jgi:two-component system aerobic respiration control sensor histidine kinase ArcB
MPEHADYWSKKEFITELLIDKLPAYVFWKNAAGVYLGCNQAFAESVGLLSAKDIVGKTDYDLPATKEESDAYRADDKAVMQSNKAKINIEETQTIQDGKKITLLTSKVPLTHNGQVVGILGIYNNITELKNTQNELITAKEKAEAADKSKTEFVQNMQHDIRTPTSGVWGVLNVLTNTEPDDNRREALNMALTASKRLLDLCNDAVEFGDLSGNHRPPLEKTLDIRELAKSVVELNLPAAFAKDLVIHFKVDPTVPPHILSDEFRISRILINLMGNAVKFSHQGKIDLSIKAKIDKEDVRHGVLIIDIKDNGIGIAQNKINHIFEKFTRAVASNTNKYPGTGLGLYVVKTFLDELDGDIEVESHENEGAYFKISIPFKILWEDVKTPGVKIDEHFNSPLKETREKEESIQAKVEQASEEKTPFAHELLIIEDDKTCLFAEKNLLSGFTNKIDSAENVADALKRLAVKRYDLVISDLGLPDGSGNDIVAQIKASPESPNYQTPFVAMTAHQDAAKHKQAMDAGFDAVGTKPLSTEKAIEFLKTYPTQGAKAEPKEEGPLIIDLALGMQRIRAKTEGNAIEALGILYETLQEDIPNLKAAEKKNDIAAAREVLHKIRGGLYYTGTPRLEAAFKELHDEVKRVHELSKIDFLFQLAYAETKIFSDEFKKLIGIDKK